MTIYNKSKKYLQRLDTDLNFIKLDIQYQKPIPANSIIDTLYNNYRRLFTPFFPILRISLLTLFLSLIFASLVNRITMGTYKGIKLNEIIIILITLIWLIIEFKILSQSRKWRQKLWQISLRRILTVLHVKDSKECFELIDVLKHHEEKLSRKKERKRASFSSFSINLLLTILTGIFTITSALLKENYLNPIKAHWSAIMFILINIIMPILFTSIILILFIYKTTQETSLFNKSQRINMIVDELYKFNYKKIQKKDHNINKSKELSVAKQK